MSIAHQRKHALTALTSNLRQQSSGDGAFLLVPLGGSNSKFHTYFTCSNMQLYNAYYFVSLKKVDDSLYDKSSNPFVCPDVSLSSQLAYSQNGLTYDHEILRA